MKLSKIILSLFICISMFFIGCNNFITPNDYDKDVFKKRNSSFKDYQGLYSSKNKTTYIYIKDCYTDVLALNHQSACTKNVLMHEYTHHMFYEFMNNNHIDIRKVPIWFIEGISQYIGYEGAYAYLNPPETLIDFSKLKTSDEWTKYTNNGCSTYEQSHYAVSQLILMKGENVIKDILLKTKDKDFNTAFNDTMGFSIESYEKRLKEDCKNNWKNYNKMIPIKEYDNYTNIKIECLEKYIKTNPNNINALMDLANLYENIGELDKAKLQLSLAVKKKPEDNSTWRRLAIIYENMNDFDNAIKAYEKEASLEKNNSKELVPTYISLAQVMLLKDMNKSVDIAKKAKEMDKSSFVNKQTQQVINFKNSIENGRPYEGCLNLIKSETIISSNIQKALIEKMLKDYPSIRCKARSELEKIKNS